ncbi:MAG: hypothetical protein Q9225_006406 [Loekoesia sp. 1 TL-2023]
MSKPVNESPKPSPPRKRAKFARDADDLNDASAELDLSTNGQTKSGDEADIVRFSDDGLDSDFESAEEEGVTSDSDMDEVEEAKIADEPVAEAVPSVLERVDPGDHDHRVVSLLLNRHVLNYELSRTGPLAEG